MNKKLKYDKLALQNAVDAVKSKSMGYLKASQIYNVPRSTIFDKVKEISSIDCRTGPHTILSPAEEERLAKWCIEMSRIGYGRSKQELLSTVQKIIQADGRPTPFKEQRPGKDWYYGFMKRHPEISLRSPRQLGKERAVIKPEQIAQWFDDFKAFIQDTVDDPYILKDPSRMYNADESGFSMSVNTGHIIGLRGAKSVYNISASDRSQITVLLGMSANAHFLRPMIVFPGQRFTRNMLEGFEEAVLGRSQTGWMDSELFVSWLQTVFIPDITARQVKKPVILFVDGHKTHMTIEASDICKENGIILYCLLAHASHLIQPCDLRLFASLKQAWKVAMREWQIEHVGQYVTKFEFAGIFKKAWEASCKVENAVNGFRDAGLFPLDKTVVLKTDKFQTSYLFCKNGTEQEEKGGAVPGQSDEVDISGNTHNREQTEKHMQIGAPDTSTPTVENVTCHINQTNELKKHSDTNAIVADVLQMIVQTVADKMKEQTGQKEAVPKESGLITESPMSKYLKIPSPAKRKKAIKRDILPKAVTGDEFRRILLERKRKREEEEMQKQARKVEREKKRQEKDEEKQRKQLIKEKRMKERKQKKEEKEQKRKLKHLLQQQRAKKSHKSDSDSDCSMRDVCDDSEDDYVNVDSNVCYKCEKKNDNGSGWIGCQKCLRFFHRSCTDMDFADMEESEVAGFPFECLFC